MPAIRPVNPSVFKTSQTVTQDDSFLLGDENPFLKSYKGMPSSGEVPPMEVHRHDEPTAIAVQDTVEVLSNNAFGIMPGMFQSELAKYSTNKIQRQLKPGKEGRGDQVLMPMVPSEDKGHLSVRDSWKEANKNIANDINTRMKMFFKGFRKPNASAKALSKRKQKVTATLWVEDMPVVASSTSFGVFRKTWSTELNKQRAVEVMSHVFSILSSDGWGWYSQQPMIDLYKKGNHEVAVYSDGENLHITAFKK